MIALRSSRTGWAGPEILNILEELSKTIRNCPLRAEQLPHARAHDVGWRLALPLTGSSEAGPLHAAEIIRLQAGIAKGDSLKIVCCQYVRLWINNHAPMTMKLLHDGADDLVKLQKAEAP